MTVIIAIVVLCASEDPSHISLRGVGRRLLEDIVLHLSPNRP